VSANQGVGVSSDAGLRRSTTRYLDREYHAVRETPGDVLDVDAVAPPVSPATLRGVVLGVKVPATTAAFVRERAWQDGVTVNAYLRRLIEVDRDGGLPADCREWLRVQAGQCDCPGDPHGALVAVLRHLADRWPDGARLR
jgi:hypothetical protein